MAVLACALFAVSAFAQYQTGNIYGKTTSNDGSPLPGVTVTLSGVGAPQSAVSDADGNFRFINLSPGRYSLKAELSGMGTVTRSGIGVSVGSNADVSMQLNPSMSEAITVSAEAPLLDVRKSGTGSTVDATVLQDIPTARDPWMILQSTPGVFVDRINVGGTQSGQQSVYVSKGAPRADGTWNVDGVNITDMGATGSSPTYYDFDTFEEMQVTTGGSDPRIQTAGVQMNMVTKRGTNDINGAARYLYVPGSSSAEATVPSEAAGYLSLTNKVNYVRDYGGDVGGPIWRDRAWLWLARADQKISTWQSLGNDPRPTFFIPDDTILRNKNAKLNAQIMTSNSFVASYTYGDKFRNARDLSPLRPFETAWTQTGPTEVYKLEDTQLFGANLYLTGMWSKVKGGFGLYGNGGEGESAPSMWFDGGNVAHDNYYTYITDRPQKQYRLDGSYFTDIAGTNHEFKFGYGYRDTPVDSASIYPGPSSGYWDYSFGTALCTTNSLSADCGVAVLYRPPLQNYSGKYNELYIGDTMMFGSFTLQAGLRYDDQSSAILPIDVSPNPILASSLTLPCITTLTCTGGSLATQLPGIDYPGQDEELNWKSLSPRIGLTYALGEQKKTLIRAAYNRYVSQLGSTVASSSPVGSSQFTFLGIDANGDHTIQRSELQKVRSFAGINPANPASLTSTRRIDYDMNPPTTDEFLVGVEHELWSDFSVGLTFTHRVNNDLPVVRFEKTQGGGDYYTSADYELATVTAGGTFKSKYYTVTTPVVPVYQLKTGVATPTFSVITNRPDYSQTYNGLEVTATKRLANKWMLRVNASYNDYTEDCGADSYANPTPALPATGIVNGAAAYGGPPACIGGQLAPQSAGSGAFGNVFINSKWNGNISGLYQAPWGINVGANLLMRQGYPEVYRTNVAVRGGTATVALEEIGERRFDNVYQLDLRLAKDFRIMSWATFEVGADIFNATNQRTILQRNDALLNSTANPPTGTGHNITEIQAPRVYRIGAKLTF
ncbi:MAG TPA: carboxypeptidase regulatory-like domain-containing protein [Thermoanaerobaculia bacterium]|nr:carboxypeptidase regulatory-like domain-containing protein [Thermoanaerobaculia bacterium]